MCGNIKLVYSIPEIKFFERCVVEQDYFFFITGIVRLCLYEWGGDYRQFCLLGVIVYYNDWQEALILLEGIKNSKAPAN